MTEPRNKKENLSETTKAYLREIYIEEVYGRKKEITNKYIEKGIYVEEDSLELISLHYSTLLFKNKDTYENDFVKGTPDIVYKGKATKIIDAKSSWSIYSFFEADGTDKNYFWQGQGYMWLTGVTQFDLAYCLNNAPEHIIVSEKTRQMYHKFLQEGTNEFNEMEQEVEKNMIFDDIPANKRIKIFSYEYDSQAIERLQERIIHSRSFLNSLDL